MGAVRSHRGAAAIRRIRLRGRLPSSRVLKWVFTAAAIVLLFYALYGWTLGAFLLRTPLIDLDRTISADELTVFQLDAVGHFEGLTLTGDPVEISYRLPALVNASDLGQLEVLTAPGPGSDGVSGSVHVRQADQRYTIDGARERIPWTVDDQPTTLTLTAPQATPEQPTLVAVRAHGAAPWGRSLLLTAGSVVSLLLARRFGLRISARSTVPLLVLALAMAVFWSGGLISLEYFGSGHGRLSGMAIRLGEALETGHFNQTQYRPPTFALPAFLTFPLEGTAATLRDIVRVYPVTRYVLTVIFFCSFAFLTHAWTRRLGLGAGIVLALLLGTFYPFIHDAFFPDVDALLIPISAASTAIVINWTTDPRRPWLHAAALLLLFALAASLKASALALLPMFAAFAIAHYRNVSVPRRLALTFAGLIALTGVYFAASELVQTFHHPDRNVGIDGVEFQQTHVWHLLWGGYGHFDRDTAFDFTSIGSERNRIVSEELDLPDVGYLRQAQQATESVYRPGVINALEELPSFFVSTAFHRFERHALRLYRYTAGSGGLIDPWVRNEPARVDHLDGEAVSQPDLIQESTRLGRYWRVAPLVTLVRLQQGELSKAADLFLLGLAALGLALLPVPGVRAYLLTGGLVQIAMISGVHVMYRYGTFLSLVFLLGLSWLAVRVVVVLRQEPL